MVDDRREVIESDLVPAESPEVLVEDAVRVKSDVVAGVVIATGIAEPHVVTGIGKDISWNPKGAYKSNTSIICTTYPCLFICLYHSNTATI